MKEEVKYIDVNEKIVMMRLTGTEFNDGNIICINQSDGLLFIDAGRKVAIATAFRKEMEKRFNKKAKLLVLTHLHVDHMDGIAAFKDLPIIVSQTAYDIYRENDSNHHYTKEGRTKYVEYMKEGHKRGEVELTDAWFNDWSVNFMKAEIYPPTLGVKDELMIGYGDEAYSFKGIGGHSPCSAFLYNEKEGILIAGDNFNCDHADNSACMLAGAITGIDILKKFEKMNFSKILPGHGPAVDKEYITKTREYLEKIHSVIKELKKDGLTKEDFIKYEKLPKFFEEKIPHRWDTILSNWYELVE